MEASYVNNCTFIGPPDDGTNYSVYKELIRLNDDGTAMVYFEDYIIIHKDSYGIELGGLKEEWEELWKDLKN